MPARIRKLIGGAGMLIFLAAYIWAATSLYARLPDWFWLKLAYMAVAGIGWGVPLIPFIAWMNRGR